MAKIKSPGSATECYYRTMFLVFLWCNAGEEGLGTRLCAVNLCYLKWYYLRFYLIQDHLNSDLLANLVLFAKLD